MEAVKYIKLLWDFWAALYLNILWKICSVKHLRRKIADDLSDKRSQKKEEKKTGKKRGKKKQNFLSLSTCIHPFHFLFPFQFPPLIPLSCFSFAPLISIPPIAYSLFPSSFPSFLDLIHSLPVNQLTATNCSYLLIWLLLNCKRKNHGNKFVSFLLVTSDIINCKKKKKLLVKFFLSFNKRQKQNVSPLGRAKIKTLERSNN